MTTRVQMETERLMSYPLRKDQFRKYDNRNFDNDFYHEEPIDDKCRHMFR